MTWVRAALGRHETVLALVVVALVLALGTTTSGFFSLANLYDLSKSMVVTPSPSNRSDPWCPTARGLW